MNVKLLLGIGLLLGGFAFFFFLPLDDANHPQGGDLKGATTDQSVEKIVSPVNVASDSVKQKYVSEKNSLNLKSAGQPNQSKNPSSSEHSVDKSFPMDIERVEKESDIVLWEDLNDAKDIEINTVKAKQFNVDPSLLDQFHVGQNIEFGTLLGQQTMSSELTSTSNQLGGVAVWKGKIKDGHPNDNVIITQGKIETHVVVSTTQGTYTTIIDNRTGSATLVDEGDIVAGQVPTEDGIHVEGIDDTPPT